MVYKNKENILKSLGIKYSYYFKNENLINVRVYTLRYKNSFSFKINNNLSLYDIHKKVINKLYLKYNITFKIKQKTNKKMKIITYNIRHDLNDLFKKNSWFKRRKHLIEVIKKHDADIICLQEVGLLFQKFYLKRKFPEYNYVESRGKLFFPGNAILYKKNIEGNVYKGKLFGGKEVRSYITLSTKKVNITNTHLDLRENVREKHIKVLLDKTNKNKASIILGDLNYRVYQGYSHLFLDKGYESVDIVEGTFNGFNFGNISYDQIDYIFYKDLELLEYDTDMYSFQEKFPSDHFPIIAEFK